MSRTAAWWPSTSCGRSRRSRAACGSSSIAVCSRRRAGRHHVAGGGALRIPAGRARAEALRSCSAARCGGGSARRWRRRRGVSTWRTGDRSERARLRYGWRWQERLPLPAATMHAVGARRCRPSQDEDARVEDLYGPALWGHLLHDCVRRGAAATPGVDRDVVSGRLELGLAGRERLTHHVRRRAGCTSSTGVLAGAVVTEVGCEEPERPVAEAPPVGGATDVDVVEDFFAGAVPGVSGGRTDPDVARCCDAEMLPPELQEAAAASQDEHHQNNAVSSSEPVSFHLSVPASSRARQTVGHK